MLSWRRSIANVGALSFALTVASPSVAQSGSPVTQSGIVIFWNTAKCSGGYHSDFYSAHCDPGPFCRHSRFQLQDAIPLHEP